MLCQNRRNLFLFFLHCQLRNNKDSKITHRGLCPQAVGPSPGGLRKSRLDYFCT